MASHASRVRETSTTTGTGTLSLAGAVSGYRTFVAGIGNGRSAFYTIRNRDVPTEWEVGVGIVTDASTDTLSRVTVIRSSNSDALVNFSAGTKDVYVSIGEEATNRLQQIPLRVKVATTANITLSATQTIDGVSAGVGDRVLVKNQSTASQNGIYVAASGSWTRAVDCATGDPASCMLVLVDQGTVGANTAWICTTNSGSDVVGTNSLAFARIDSQAITGTAAGILCSDGAGTINPRTLTAGTGVTITNGTGASGNPTVAIGQPVATSSQVQFANIGINAAPLSQRGLYANPVCTGAGGHYGGIYEVSTSGTAPSILAGNVVGVFTQMSGSAQTYADVRGLWVNSTNKVQAGDSVTTNYGILVSDQAVSGATNWGLYTNSGDNYHGDDLLIGTTTTPGTNSGKSLMFGASGGNVTPGASTCGLFGKTVTQVEVFAVDSAANVTQLSPHPDKVMDGHADLCRELGVEPVRVPWGYESEQAAAGVITRVDLAALVRVVEMLASDRLGKPVRLLVEETVDPSMDWEAREAEADEQHAAQVKVYEHHVAAFREQVAQRETLPPLLRAQAQRPLFAGGRRPHRHRTEKPKYLGG